MPVLGSEVTLSASFVFLAAPTDPDELTLSVIDPNGASVVDTWPAATLDPTIIVRDSAGAFHRTWTPDVVGVYRWRWEGTGAAGAVTEGTVDITSLLAPQTYATLDRTKALFESVPKAARLARLATALREATDELIDEMDGRDFFRHPTVGDAAFALSDTDGRFLHVHDGIVSITTLELRTGSSYTVLTEGTDYRLRGSSPMQDPPPGAHEPAFHIELLGRASWQDGARLTGVLGWGAIPDALAAGCAARARQLTYGDANYEGALPSDPQFGPVSFTGRWPDVTWKFLQRQKQQFYACLFAPVGASVVMAR